MTEHKSHPEGTFCWHDLMTTDLGKSIEFYGSLFGWQMEILPPSDASPMEYAMCSLDGKLVCGMGPLTEEMKANGVPTVWSSYLCARDIDAWAARVTELGGEIQMPPEDIGEFGRIAFFKSPTGEVFGAWQPGMHPGAQVTGAPGSAFWNEVASPDTGKSRPFYESLCGWDSQIKDFEHTNYTYFQQGDQKTAGMIQMTKEWGDMPAHWMIYFAVEDCDEAAKKIEALGGNVCVPPTDIPVGRFAVVNDPTGGNFTIIKPDPNYQG